MLVDVATRALRDQRRALLAWVVALVALVGMYAGFYPSLHGSASYTDVIHQLPKALRDLFTLGAGGDLSSGPGYLNMEVLSFMAPTVMLVYAIGAGSQAVAGEEERRTLDLLLATPLTRTRLLLGKALALLAGIGVLATAMGTAIVAFGAATSMQLSTVDVVASMVHLALLAAVFAGVALAVGCRTGRVTPARAVAAGAAVVSFVVNGFAPSVSWLHPVRKLSPFYQYAGHDPIRNGFAFVSVGVAAVTAVVLVGVAVQALRRRDLG